MLSQTSIHAIRALMFLAAKSALEPIGSTQLASEIQAPANYLGKTLQHLTLNGILISQRGLGGGIRLAKDPSEITLFDIVEPLEHVSQKSHCFMNRLCCGPEPCQFHARWVKIHSDFLDFLKSVTIKDLVQQNKINPQTFSMPGFRKED